MLGASDRFRSVSRPASLGLQCAGAWRSSAVLCVVLLHYCIPFVKSNAAASAAAEQDTAKRALSARRPPRRPSTDITNKSSIL